MPKQRKNNRTGTAARGKNRALPVFLSLLIVLGVIWGWMAWNARTCHVCMADVYMADLPAQMDGTTLLFISDLDLQNRQEAKDALKLMNKLNQLHPDVLLLGGDYSAQDTVDLLNNTEASTPEYVLEFASSLSGFYAPLGKFAVLGEKDVNAEALTQAFSSAGVTCLTDDSAELAKDGAAIRIVGLNDYSRNLTPYTRISGGLQKSDCVIVAAHNPNAYAEIRTAEASDGGAWVDVVLSGHTLGGQIWLLGRNLRGEKENRAAFSGWQHVNDVPMLISQGLGCEGAHLRLGSRSEVWLITLRKQIAG